MHERLGVGGMACVYRGRRRGDPTARDVAVKRLHPHLTEDATAVASFVREARIACLLDHPAIRRVYALCREPGELFMTMEYVAGHSLYSVLKRASLAQRPLSVRGVLSVLQRLCEALHYAHELVDEHGTPAGFVHRDISPSNVLVSTTGELKLIDMGVARAYADDLHSQAGVVKGKYGYMAPEVLWARPFDRRADVFSIGVVAWELLTLCKLFPIRQPPVDIARVRSRVIPPPSRRNRDCPPELDDLVLRALAVEPADRWQSCAAFAAALGAFAERHGHPLDDVDTGELVDVVDEPTLVTEPPGAVVVPRLARGTTDTAFTRAPPRAANTSATERSSDRSWRSLLLGAVVGSLGTVAGVVVPGYVESSDAPDPRHVSVPARPVSAASPPSPASQSVSPVPTTSSGDVATVVASQMMRVSGPWPRSRSGTYPYRARLCTDTQGRVVSAVVVDGPARLASRITWALLRWRYRPYAPRGSPRPACFVVSSNVRKLAAPRFGKLSNRRG